MAEAETRHEGGDGAAAAAYKKGAWSKEEDEKLKRAVEEFGDKNWVRIERFSGLARPAKNCRLRWLNYLRPNLKKYPFTKEEEDLIFELHAKYGNTWSRIASKVPGRSDNEIKNFWHKTAKKRQREKLRICPTPNHNNNKQNQNQNQNHNHTNHQVNKSELDASTTSTTMISTPQPSTLLFHNPQPLPPIPTSPAHQRSLPNAPPFLSQQMQQWPSSPLSLKPSPGLAAPLNSPNAPPFSPLNLRLSMPASFSDSCLPIQELSSSSPTQSLIVQEQQLPSIQFNPPPQTSGVNSYMHEAESYSNMEIIDELRKAQARVRFLKRKLRQRGISNKTHLFNQTPTNKHLFIKTPAETRVLLDERKDGIQVKSSTNLCAVQEREKSESGECVQGSSIVSEMSAHGANSDSKASVENDLEREEEYSMDEILKMKDSETNFQEQRHSMDLLDHVSTQYNVIPPNSNVWNVEGLVIEGDLFGRRSQIDEHASLMDAIGPVCSQSIAKAGDELSYGDEYLKYSFFGQEFADVRFPESLPVLHQSSAAVDQLESSNLVHESPQGGQHFSLQTSGEQLCQSSFIQQHEYHEEADLTHSTYSESNQQYSDIVVHHHQPPSDSSVMHLRSQHYYPTEEFYGGITMGEETWKQELWAEDQTFFLDRFDFTC